MNQSPIILFEPICRGSRLQILANTVSAIRKYSARPIKVVTRSDYATPHLSELMGENRCGVEFVTADTDLGGDWIKILTLGEMKAMLVALDRVTENCGPADIVFMALDEYMKPLLPHLGWIRKRFSANRFFVMKYRVEYLLPDRCMKNWRAFLLSMLTRWVLLRTRARLVCFDERFIAETFFGKPVAVIPDPWFGDFSPLRRNVARAKYGYHDNEFVVLTLGRQDRRKGFPQVLEIVPQLFNDASCRLFVVGKVDPEFIDSFDQLKARFPEKIVHIERFIDEAELPDVFASADVFLLPYALDFTSTSGTLPRAAASGVPVISGSHGLVGHRIRRFGLGEVFQIENANGMLSGIAAIHAYTSAQRLKVATALNEFAVSAHIYVFEKAVGNLFAYPGSKVN